ncbi:hypothetical protein SELMODRAFT_83651 [Selaginella moellendorffii]|uniref:Tyrosine specific protein phosphatases domain-containing protein n=1 Tax=Selaginella moellendorffii TaxID=88036 RepID=D8R2K3_SELML|nr:hypothetical protein SELMODRAFT_83651 [Selaginella moellendorffii]
MGLSLAVGIPAALILAVGAALLGVVSNRIFLLPLLHTSLIGFTVALFSHPRIDNPRILAKSSRGSFPIWSSFLFYPYLAGTRLYVRFRRRAGLEATYTEVCDGLFVGAWPFQREHIPPGNPAILDCTNELPRTVGLELPYLCVPAWDTRALSPESIELAVRWALVQRSQSHPVFIHCAKGKLSIQVDLIALFLLSIQVDLITLSSLHPSRFDSTLSSLNPSRFDSTLSSLHPST